MSEQGRLRAWAECVHRLINVAPVAAVMRETGTTGGHTTPEERKAIRVAAHATVDQWLERDIADLDAKVEEMT